MRALLTRKPRQARLGRGAWAGGGRVRPRRGGHGAPPTLVLLGLLASSACAEAPYIELQLADVELPFLQPERDFDGVRVDVRRDGCSDATQRFAAAPLPATVTLVPGECYVDALELSATVTLGERDVARSAWRPARFDGDTPAVVTATLSDVPGRRTLFSTGFEPGQAGGDSPTLALAARRGFSDAEARLDTTTPLTGAQAVLIAGTATTSGARLLARLAVTNVVIARGDELVVTLELASASTVHHVGLDLELATGDSADSLGLTDRAGRRVTPRAAAGRSPGVREQWIVDLSPAAGARLVGVLAGADLAGEGAPGRLELRVDDVSLVRP